MAAKLPDLLLGLVLLGLLIRLSIRDSVPGLATVFYGAPYPVLALVAACLGVWHFARSERRRGVLSLMLCVVALGLFLATSRVQSMPASSSGGEVLRVLFWNTARPAEVTPGVLAPLIQTDADIIGLVELGKTNSPKVWLARFPEYQCCRFGAGMAFLVRGQILSHSYTLSSNGRGRFGHAVVQVRGKRLRLLLVDMHSNPFVSKRGAFEAFYKMLDQADPAPLLVMGDFNTPLESCWFDGVTARGYVQSFEAAGAGLRETWPAFLPLLTIDHLWASPGVIMRWCRLLATSESDHKVIAAGVELPSASSAGNAPPFR